MDEIKVFRNLSFTNIYKYLSSIHTLFSFVMCCKSLSLSRR